jgi:hypothetical protein
MKDLLDLDKLLTVDSKKCVLLYILGFKVTRGVDFHICGWEVTFLLQGMFILKTRGKLNFCSGRVRHGINKNGLPLVLQIYFFLSGFFAPQIQVFLYLLYNLYNVFKYFTYYSK